MKVCVCICTCDILWCIHYRTLYFCFVYGLLYIVSLYHKICALIMFCVLCVSFHFFFVCCMVRCFRTLSNRQFWSFSSLACDGGTYVKPCMFWNSCEGLKDKAHSYHVVPLASTDGLARIAHDQQRTTKKTTDWHTQWASVYMCNPRNGNQI